MSKKIEVPPYEKKSYITESAIDTHAHLDYEDIDVQDVLKNMSRDGLRNIITIATGLKSFKRIEEIIKKDDRIYFALGLHPYDIMQFNEAYVEELGRIAKTYGNKMVAVGEIGLDQYGEVPDIDFQKRILKEQLKIANELKKPVILHIRNAQSQMIDFLNENKDLLKCGGVVHCFSGNKEDAQKFLELGLYLSFTGAITYIKPKDIAEQKEMLSSIPVDRIMVETDCPYLSPSPYRGKTNTPKMVLVTAEYIADMYEIDVNIFITKTTENAKRLFKI